MEYLWMVERVDVKNRLAKPIYSERNKKGKEAGRNEIGNRNGLPTGSSEGKRSE